MNANEVRDAAEQDRTCFFCCKPGPVVCDDAECQRHDRELQTDLDQIHRDSVRKACWAALKNRCKAHNSGRSLNRIKRWFYTAKCLVCVALGFDNQPTPHWKRDEIYVAQYHFAKLYAGWESSWIEVGRGVFTGWWYQLEDDGDWDM